MDKQHIAKREENSDKSICEENEMKRIDGLLTLMEIVLGLVETGIMVITALSPGACAFLVVLVVVLVLMCTARKAIYAAAASIRARLSAQPDATASETSGDTEVTVRIPHGENRDVLVLVSAGKQRRDPASN